MRTQIDIADLVMLQMMGQLDEYMSKLRSGENTADLVENVRSRTTVPDLYSGIVTKTVRAQFGHSDAVVREFGQNGLDAYDESPKTVDFSTSTEGEYFVVKARDYGRGMDLEGVLKNLFIPFNSDKGEEHIGEHGIGWWSIMDSADKVEVVTGRDGTLWAQVEKIGHDKWQGTTETVSGNFKGTEVKAYIPKDKLDEQRVREAIVTYLGRVDSESADINLNGQKLNTIDRDYELGASAKVVNNQRSDTLDIRFRKPKDRDYTRNVVLTSLLLLVTYIPSFFLNLGMRP